MATITASLTLTSDITTYGLGISKSMTLTKAGTDIGIDDTNGLRIKSLTALTAVVLELAADATAGGANKVYIRNTSADKAEHVKISFNASASADTTVQIIGHLYGGDWMLIPWDASDTTHNICAAPSSVVNPITVEYMTFHQ